MYAGKPKSILSIFLLIYNFKLIKGFLYLPRVSLSFKISSLELDFKLGAAVIPLEHTTAVGV